MGDVIKISMYKNNRGREEMKKDKKTGKIAYIYLCILSRSHV